MRALHRLFIAVPLALLFACATSSEIGAGDHDVTSADAGVEESVPAPVQTDASTPAASVTTAVDPTEASPASACAKDSAEPNDTTGAAKVLGTAGDEDVEALRTFVLPNLATGDHDEDWFVVGVRDEGLNGNPRLEVVTTDRLLEVTVMYQCNNNQDFSSCEVGEPDATHGAGCRSTAGTVMLDTECGGLDESGTAYIRVRPALSTGACHAYDLTVTIH